MQINCQERIGEDGEPFSVPVIPPGAAADEIEAIVAAERSAVLTDEPAGSLDTSARESAAKGWLSDAGLRKNPLARHGSQDVTNRKVS